MILEEYLLGMDRQEAFLHILPIWLQNICELPITHSYEAMLHGLGIHVDSLIEYAEQVSSLLMRCAVNYDGPDAIRTKDGKAPADPLNYPPKPFLVELDRLGIYELQHVIDICAQRAHVDFANNAISLCKVVAQGWAYARNFEYPDYFDYTMYVELPVDTDEQKIELMPGVHWNGSIDWVFRDLDGCVTIADHKTSKDLPNEYGVQYHEQLNLYAVLYYELYDEWPDYIGINHLKSNTLVRVRVDPQIASNIYNYYREVVLDICKPNQSWLRKSPIKRFNTGTPCVKEVRGQAVTCPMLSTCWPLFKVDL